MLWIKEVEMVESVDDLKSSRSMRGTHGPDFEVLDARIASALNNIIHNSHFKRRISLEEQKAQKQDRFLRCDCCGLILSSCEQPTASSRFGSTGVLWVLTGTHRCDTPIQAG